MFTVAYYIGAVYKTMIDLSLISKGEGKSTVNRFLSYLFLLNRDGEDHLFLPPYGADHLLIGSCKFACTTQANAEMSYF